MTDLSYRVDNLESNRVIATYKGDKFSITLSGVIIAAASLHRHRNNLGPAFSFDPEKTDFEERKHST